MSFWRGFSPWTATILLTLRQCVLKSMIAIGRRRKLTLCQGSRRPQRACVVACFCGTVSDQKVSKQLGTIPEIRRIGRTAIANRASSVM